jgi:hypothetical protein
MAIKTKQIDWTQYASIKITGQAGAGASTVVTASITTALSTAGRGNVSVPLQVSTSGGVGVITAPPDNRVEIFANGTKNKITVAGNELFGRLTESGGAYTLTYFSLVAGAETATNLPASSTIDFDFIYCFDAARLPINAITAQVTRNVSSDPSGGGATPSYVVREQLTVTATNTVSSLSKTPTSVSVVVLEVNEASYHSFGGANAFFSVNLGTKAITWNPTAPRGFILETTDTVIADYTTIDP